MSFLGFFKHFIFIYNFILTMTGAALLTMALYFYVDTLQYIEASARTWPIYSTFFLIVIAIGLMTLIVGFFGCCGACKESSCMLCLYFTIVLVICGLAGAILFMPDKFELNQDKIKSDLQLDIKEIIQKSYTRSNNSSVANMVIDKIQEDFQCCGSENYTDWANSLLNNGTSRPDLGVGNGGYTSYVVANPLQQQTLPGNNNPRLLQSPTTNTAFQAQPQRQTFNLNYRSSQQQPQPSSPPVQVVFRVPASCCSMATGESTYKQCKAMIVRYDEHPNDYQVQRIPNVNPDGCVEKVYYHTFVVNWLPLLLIGALTIGLQGLSLIFSLCLCCAINRAVNQDYDDEK